jgi:hypothetical protein
VWPPRRSITASLDAVSDKTGWRCPPGHQRVAVGQLLKACEDEVVERAEIARQLLDREVAPDHAPLRAEQVEEFGHDPAHFLFVAGIAEPAERRQHDVGMGKLRQHRHAGPPGPQTRVCGGVRQPEMLEHHGHLWRVCGDRGGLRQLRGPYQQVERQTECCQ